jgi:hypothetical protein
MSNSTESANLLPCPFCGENPAFFRNENNGQWEIFCKRKTLDCPLPSLSDFTAEKAIKRWNNRAAIPKPTPQGTDSAERQAFEKWFSATYPMAGSDYADSIYPIWQAARRDSNAPTSEDIRQLRDALCEMAGEINLMQQLWPKSESDDRVKPIENQLMGVMLKHCEPEFRKEIEVLRDSNAELYAALEEIEKEALAAYGASRDATAKLGQLATKALARHSSRMGETKGDVSAQPPSATAMLMDIFTYMNN